MMSGRGKAFAVLSVLMLVIGISLGALPAWASQGNGHADLEQYVQPANANPINYPAFPIAGGPYITAATYRPTGGVAGGDPDVYAVFNEPLDSGTVTAADFSASGFTFSGITLTAGNRSVIFNGVNTAPANGASVRMIVPGAVGADDDSLNTDVSPITISTGPVIVMVTVNNASDTIPNNDELVVTFDAPVEPGSNADATITAAFRDTPEFRYDGTGNDLHGVFDAPSRSVAITRVGTGTVADWGQILPGVTKLILRAGTLTWDAGNTNPNGQEYKKPVENIGPHIVAAYYNDKGGEGSGNDELWIVLSQPTPQTPGPMTGPFNMDPDAQGWGPDNASVGPAFPGSFTAVLKATAFAGGTLTAPDSTDLLAFGTDTDLWPTNYQLLQSGVADSTIRRIYRGPGIIRSSYDDRQDDDATNDRLYIWINEIAAIQDSIDVDDFTFTGFTRNNLLRAGLDTTGSIEKVTIRGFSNANRWTPGSRVRGARGNDIVGRISGDTLSTRYPIVIEDESRPFAVDLAVNTAHTYDNWRNAFPPQDTIYVAWQEIGARDDSDQYFLYTTRQDTLTNLIDDTWLINWMSRATPLGNLRPGNLDLLTKVGFTVNGDSTTMTTDGDTLRRGDNVYVIVAAADFQGNLAKRSDPGNAVRIFGPFRIGPGAGELRAYIQPEFCPNVPGGIEVVEGTVGLYALQYAPDAGMDAVRFERWYDVNENNCAVAPDSTGGGASRWIEIGTDDANNEDYWGPRGDQLLYMNETNPDTRDPLEELDRQGHPFLGQGYAYRYWPREQYRDFYKLGDPIIDSDDLVFGPGDDVVIGGEEPIPAGAVLRDFEANQFWTEGLNDTGNDDNVLEETDYLFQDNEFNTTPAHDLELWYIAWDPTGLPGNPNDQYPPEHPFLVGAVAIDVNGNEDELERLCYLPNVENPLEVERVEFSTTRATNLQVTAFSLDENGVLVDTLITTFPNPVALPGSTLYVRVEASTTGESMLFSSLPNTLNFGVNEDSDWYTNLDTNPGFQLDGGVTLATDDEIFFDIGTIPGVYDAGDRVLNRGRNGVVDTPLGTVLLPLVSEDPVGDFNGDGDDDDDGDGFVDEDPAGGEDTVAPFVAYLDLTNINMANGFQIVFAATPTGTSCPSGTEAGIPVTGLVNFDENVEPEVWVWRVENEDDMVIDVWPTVSDSTPYGIIGSETDTLKIFATASDSVGIDSVRVFYRVDPNCGVPSAGPVNWTRAATIPSADGDYPWRFLKWPVGIGADSLPNGVYQFYLQAEDLRGNFSVIPVFPNGFRKLMAPADFANLTTPAGNDTVMVGEQYLLEVLSDGLEVPADSSNIGVEFYFAPRIVNEPISVAMIPPSPPYRTQPLTHDVYFQDDVPGHAVRLTVNGTPMPYDDTPEDPPAAGHFRIIQGPGTGDDVVEFGSRPASTATVLISYNFDAYVQIGTGDDRYPFTVEFEWLPGGGGGVPDPADLGWDGADAYDLIAIACFDVDDDDNVDASGECDYCEPLRTENTYLFLQFASRPMLVLFGLTMDETPANDYPDSLNIPGNPLFHSIAGNVEWKLSGNETDLFVRATDAAGDPDGVTDVTADIVAFHPVEGTTDTTSLVFTKYEMNDDITQNTVPMKFSFYAGDFPLITVDGDTLQFTADDVENITLRLRTPAAGDSIPGSGVHNYVMTVVDRMWSVTVPVRYDEMRLVHSYTFEIDLIGDTQREVLDPRNWGGAPAMSAVVTPKAPFWFRHLDNQVAGTMLWDNSVHDVTVWATDTEGQMASNLNGEVPEDEPGEGDPQGPIQFIYDRQEPIVQSIQVFTDPSNMDPGTDILVIANDEPFTDINVITIERVVLQYRIGNDANGEAIWLVGGVDDDPSDGWLFRGWVPDAAPNADNFDNDGDGLIDEDDPSEAVFTYDLRAIAIDDAMNAGRSDEQDPPVVATVTVDSAEPRAVIDLPMPGTVFAYGDEITITATAVGDFVFDESTFPAPNDPEVAYVAFQYRDGRTGWFQGVASPHDPSRPMPFYDSGVDAVFANVNGNVDINGNPIYNHGVDEILFTPSGFNWASHDATVGFGWFDIDATPVDSGDNPWVVNDGSGLFTVTFDSNSFWMTEDTYVHLRAIARDTAGNWDTANDGFAPPEVVIILDDNTGPIAFLTTIEGSCPDSSVISPDEAFGLRGVVTLHGSYRPLARTAYVTIWADGEASDPFVVGVVANGEPGWDNPVEGQFELTWDTDVLPEGTYTIYALATDDDGNVGTAEGALQLTVVIDRTPPSVNFDPILPNYLGLVDTRFFQNNGVVDDSSLVVFPDPDTGDALFAVTTTDDDIVSVQLQWSCFDEPLGTWRPWSELTEPDFDGMFDRRANLDFDGNNVWVFNQPDFLDVVGAAGIDCDQIRFRALATDIACNTNALQDFETFTVDVDDPTLFDCNDNLADDHIAAGESVTLTFTTTDPTTDVVAMGLEASFDGGQNWFQVDADLDPEALQLDTVNALWQSVFVWTSPGFVTRDRTYQFRVKAYDSAGNWAYLECPTQIVVQDITPPDRTKITDVQGLVSIADDEADGEPLPAGGFDPECHNCNDIVWIERNGNDQLDLGIDFLISSGSFTLDDLALMTVTEEATYGDVMNTWPRDITESFLNDANVRNIVKINNQVTLVARTQGGDDGLGGLEQDPILDDGIAYVEFWALPITAEGDSAGPAISLGKDEHAPDFLNYYLWHIGWDVTETDLAGNGLWTSGDRFRLFATAVDEAGNVEVAPFDLTNAIIEIDMDAPTATMDADATTETVETTVTVERNSVFTLFARTDPANEDDDVTFFFKRERDLNRAASWGMILGGMDDPETPAIEGWGAQPEDLNPDETRPYSFDLRLGLVSDPTDPFNTTPLHVGELYDFAVEVTDEVGNSTSQITNRTASRHITVEIVDNIAPHLEIVEAVRELPMENWGDDTPIENPTRIHARALRSLTARLLTGDLDMDYAEFLYRRQGDTEWNLIDVAPDSVENRFTWQIANWDLQTLDHNTWYEVAVRGVDDVGNVDPNPDMMLVYVDFQAPPVVLLHPAEETRNGLTYRRWCDWTINDVTGDRILPLTVQVDPIADGDVVNDDVYDVIWEWKHSANSPLDPNAWSEIGILHRPLGEVYDDTNNTFTNWLMLDSLAATGLYDLRARVVDVSGNDSLVVVLKSTVDIDPPHPVQISNIRVNGEDITPPDVPGLPVEISAAGVIELFGTAWDDEPGLPNESDPGSTDVFETWVSEMAFRAARDLNGNGVFDPGAETWNDLGVVTFDPDTLRDLSNQTASVVWNTTGLGEGTYLVQVGARDECGNPAFDESTQGFAWSAPVTVIIEDVLPPIARIVHMDTDQEWHGNPPRQLTSVYALAESDPDLDYNVQFQYNVRGDNETSPDDQWVNFGIGEQVDLETDADSVTTGQLWMSQIDPGSLAEGTTVFLRALVRDEAGNRIGDLDEPVPTLTAVVTRNEFGSLVLEADDVTPDVVQSLDVQVRGLATEWLSVVVEVKMATADQTPRVVVLAEPTRDDAFGSSNDWLRNYSPGVPANDPGDTGGFSGGLRRDVSDPTVWRGTIELDWPDDESPNQGSDADCFHYVIGVTGLDGTAGTAQWIDLKTAEINHYIVNDLLGSNGVITTQAYGDLGISIEILPGALGTQGNGDDPSFGEYCLLVSPTDPPLVSAEQQLYLTPVANTAYHLEMREFETNPGFEPGYEPLVTIEYDPALAAAAGVGEEGVFFGDLTVRRWNTDAAAWVGTGISHVSVDSTANTVSFRVNELREFFFSDGNVFQLFVPNSEAPVIFASVWPNSPFSQWVTDADPTFVIFLRNPATSEINLAELTLKIDGNPMATWFSSYELGEITSADYVLGNGTATIQCTNQNDDGCVAIVVNYHHSTYPEHWLAEGNHTLTVEYRLTDDSSQTRLATQVFYTDRTAPYVEFDGGWVTNPRLTRALGFMNPNNTALTARMFDAGSGILFKHDRPWFVLDQDCDGVLDPDERQQTPVYEYGDINCWVQLDWSTKVDVWMNDGEDDQNDIDEIEERTLIITGTATTMEPWVTSTSDNEDWLYPDYVPGTDSLIVPVPFLGNTPIQDGSVIEIVWYSDKSIEQNPDGPGGGCGPNCLWDSRSQEMHIYNQGVTDWASNFGSRFVEQRFVVDMAPPACNFTLPTGTVDPSGDIVIDLTAVDAGAGTTVIDVTVIDPTGAEVPEGTEAGQFERTIDLATGRVTGTVHGPLMAGEYTIRLTAIDALGNRCDTVKVVRVESAVLAMTEAMAFPNPFNPAETEAGIHFNLSRPSDVTVRIYDFAGNEVNALAVSRAMPGGAVNLPWGGEASDGTDLANGAYICRITATDGSRTEESNLKLVIWRE